METLTIAHFPYCGPHMPAGRQCAARGSVAQQRHGCKSTRVPPTRAPPPKLPPKIKLGQAL
eukprot:scaffold1054_cov116-Isochrysis_galbana.AAC.2